VLLPLRCTDAWLLRTGEELAALLLLLLLLVVGLLLLLGTPLLVFSPHLLGRDELLPLTPLLPSFSVAWDALALPRLTAAEETVVEGGAPFPPLGLHTRPPFVVTGRTVIAHPSLFILQSGIGRASITTAYCC
jgi:hypothetical protein